MSTIDPRIATNPQLAGILNSVPMPTSSLSPNASTVVGSLHGGFSVNTNFPSFGMGTIGGGLVGSVGNAATGTGGQVVVGSGGSVTTGSSSTTGGGTTPAAGAQPPAPTGAQPTTAATPATPAVPAAQPAPAGDAAAPATTPATTTTTTADGSTGSPLAEAISGFGKANRSEPIKAAVDGASFGFPSFRDSAKSVDPPAIKWGPGWKKVQKGDMWFMQHTNGVRAVPAVEWRITPKPADKVQTIEVTNGWGKRFPNGSVLVFDRVEGAYLLDPKGNKKKMSKGNHVIDGVKVRIFEASVVRTIDKDGKVDVFDSRGNVSTGTTRWNNAAPAGADAGAAMAGGAAKPDAGPTAGGPTKAGGKDGMLVSGGGPGAFTTADIEEMTAIAREIIGEIRSGNVDPARLQALQARLEQLPAGLLQAAGAAGTMTTAGTTVAATTDSSDVGGEHGDAVPPAAGTTDGGAGSDTDGGGEGTTVTAPTPGRDANATRKDLAAGASAKVDPSVVPAELHGMQARFAQLPANVQEAVARAFGSDQGAGAFKPDRLVAFGTDGTVRVVEKGVVFLRHQVQVRGAGPGEDQVLTMKPGRQPGSAGVSGGGATAQAAHGASATSTTTTTPVAGGGAPAADAVAAADGAGASDSKSIELFAAGGEVRHEDFGGLNGTYTWKSLPQSARTVILDLLRSGSDDPAAAAFASRTGGGWSIDPNGIIVIDAGFASFPSGLSMTRGGVPGPTPAVGVPTPAGGGSAPTGQPIAHDATRPPVSGGGGVGSVAPSTPPPIPDIADPGEGGEVAGGGGSASSSHEHHHH